MSGSEKRSLRACDSCYKRKIKCDGAAPRCEWCRVHHLDCTFFRQPRPRKRRSQRLVTEKHRVEVLEDRLKSIEQALAKAIPNKLGPQDPASKSENGTSAEDSPRSSTVHNGSGVHFAGQHLGYLNSYNGVPLFSREGQDWVKNLTGENFAFTNTNGFLWHNQDVLDTSPRQVDEEPLDRAIVEKYLDTFLASPLVDIFPIMEPALISRTVTIACDEDQRGTPKSDVARFCIYSLLVFLSSAISTLHIADLPFVDLAACAAKAYTILSRLLSYPATIEVLQGTLVLSFHEAACGNVQKVEYVLSMAVRLAFALGAHVMPEHSQESQTRARHLRKLFWICYVCDKEHSFRTGRPPMLVDDHCDLTVPSRPAALTPEDRPLTNFYPSDLHLSMIKSRAYLGLYSVAARRKTDADLLKTIRELDEDLEEWRVSLPRCYRPSLAHQPQTTTGQMSVHNMHFLMLRLEYHHVTAIIHQASSRCHAWLSQTEGLTEGISSSLALSVAASRSTLLSLIAMKDSITGPLFWIVLFYPMSAVLTIFCNILSHPLDPTAREDADLLDRTSVIIRPTVSLRTESPAKSDFSSPNNARLNIAIDFIQETARLAWCAIRKAEHENATP